MIVEFINCFHLTSNCYLLNHILLTYCIKVIFVLLEEGGCCKYILVTEEAQLVHPL